MSDNAETVVDQPVIKLAAALNEVRDDILISAVSRFLGDTSWNLNIIAERGSVQSTPDGYKTFSFDGVPLVTVHPIKTELSKDGETYYLNGGFKYEFHK